MPKCFILQFTSCGAMEITGDIGSSSGSLAPEPPCPMAKATTTRIHEDHRVPPFLIELYKMINDKSTDSIISWGSSSTKFIISDEQRLVSEILPYYFKTHRLDSFISQLNRYARFQEGKQQLLKNIKRKNQQSKIINNTSMFNSLSSELKAEYAKVKMGQKLIKNKLQRYKDDIEKTLNGIQNITEDMTHKLKFTFSEGIEPKRKFLDFDHRIDFVYIEKDFDSIRRQFEMSESDDNDGFMTLSDLMQKVATKHSGCGRRVPQLLHKLYDMVENEEIDDLNFKKAHWERQEYANEWFVGGRHDLLANIKRRDKLLYLIGSVKTCSATEVKILKNGLKTIQQEQENKIIHLSNYEEQMKNSVHKFKEKVLNMANIVNKMIQRSNEELENVKKVELDIEGNVKGNGKGQELEVNELGNNHGASKENNNAEAHSYLQEMGIDPQVLEKIMEMEDTWIEMDRYMSTR